MNLHEVALTPAQVSAIKAEHAESPSPGGGGGGGGADEERDPVYKNVASGRRVLSQLVTLIPVRTAHLKLLRVV